MMIKIEGMQMTGNPWWKSFLISLVLHGVLLTSICWFVMNVSAAVVSPDEYIELDLADSPQALDTVDSTATDVVSQQSVATSVAAATVAAVSNGNAVPSVQASASGVSILSVENSSTNEGQSSSSEGGSVSPGAASAGGASGAGENGQGSGAGSASPKNRGYIIRPSIIQPQVQPNYPDQARQQGIEGTVILKIRISASGYPDSVTVFRTSRSDLLDEAAIAAAQQWRFNPARYSESGEPVGCSITWPVGFNLN